MLPQMIRGASRDEARRRAPTACSARSASASGSTTARPNCRAASSSASRSPARSPTARRWCSPTSPPATSTRPPSDRVFAEFLTLVRGEGSAALVATHNERLAREDGPRRAAPRRAARIGRLLGLFRGPRVAPRMRTTSLLILAASLSTLACGPRNADKLDDNELASAEGDASAAAGDDTRCTRALRPTTRSSANCSRRAAEIRGSNADNYARIAGFAVLQLDGAAPVARDVEPGALADCRGNATLRLPAGLTVAGGRTTLSGDIGYSVGPGAARDGHARPSDSIAIPLATLTPEPRRAAAARRPGRARSARAGARTAPEPTADPALRRGRAGPSFDCRYARTRASRRCAPIRARRARRSMAARYRAAVARGDPRRRRACWSRPATASSAIATAAPRLVHRQRLSRPHARDRRHRRRPLARPIAAR